MNHVEKQVATCGPVLEAAAARIMAALARVLLRYGVSIQAFTDISKRAYLDAAKRDFALPGRKLTRSRVALLTGLTRKEVLRLQASLHVESDRAPLSRANRAGRVIAGWRRDPDFLDGEGAARALRLDGRAPTFGELVRRYSGDIPPRAVLDELVRNGSVEVIADEVRLSSRSDLPATDEAEKLALLGIDASDFIESVNHNLVRGEGPSRFQRKVMYDNLSREAVEEFRALSAKGSQRLLEQFDAWLAQHDRDVNREAAGSGRVRAGVGIYFFEEDLDSTAVKES